MSNKTILYVVGAVVVVAVGAFLLMQGGFLTGGGTAINTPSQLMSLKDLMGRTGSQTCTFTSATTDSQSSGEVFINNGTMRGNFTSLANNQTVVSHMIVKDESVYVWSDGLAQGYKMDISALDTPPQAGAQGGVDATAPVGYDCKAGATDPSLFELPLGITFQSVGSAALPKQ